MFHAFIQYRILLWDLEYSYMILNTFFGKLFSWNKIIYDKRLLLPKVFYGDLCKALIFNVKHPRKVLIYKLFMLCWKKVFASEKKWCLFYRKKWMKLEEGIKKGWNISGVGRFYKWCFWERIAILEKGSLESVSTKHEIK